MQELRKLNHPDLVVGESPVWDADNNALWFIDSLSENGRGNDLYRMDMATEEVKSWHIGQHIGSCALSEDGRILLNLKDGIWLFDTETEEYELVSDIERDMDDNRLNDGKCDSKGRQWFGSMSMSIHDPEREFEVTGSFYKLETDGTTKKFFGDVGISNGIAWNAAETRMYFVDTPAQSVYAFDFDLEKGEVSNRKKIIEFAESEGSPDGMCIDAEDMIWVAQFGGGKVSRWNPETGEKLCEIELPCSKVTCAAFGGKDLDELYITTGTIFLSEEELKAQPLAGCTFVIKPGVKGTLPNKFAYKK